VFFHETNSAYLHVDEKELVKNKGKIMIQVKRFYVRGMG
jgi:predicted GNAT family N-acyltransferase